VIQRSASEWEREAGMRGDARMLVIGPAALGSAVAEALPRCHPVGTEALLSGLWTAGHKEFDGVSFRSRPAATRCGSCAVSVRSRRAAGSS
jgi:hypothetical protein